MTFDTFKAIVVIVATVVGICSGAYALLQSYKTNSAQAKANDAATKANTEAQRLSDKSAAITSLQQAVTAQGSVIEGLTKGLEDCIERDNAKGDQINLQNIKIAEHERTINSLNIEVARLKAKINGV